MEQGDFLELKEEIITIKSCYERLDERIDTVIATSEKLSRNFEKITGMVVNIAHLETKNEELTRRVGKMESNLTRVVMTVLGAFILALVGLVLK